jgi:TonB family protein
MKKMYLVPFLLLAVGAPAQQEAGAIGVRRFVAPAYPLVARAARIQGEVRLEVEVEESGKVLRVLQSSGPGILVEYAKANVMRMLYTRLPMETHVDVVYTFRLQGPEMESAPAPLVELASPFHVLVTSNLPNVTGYDEGINNQ